METRQIVVISGKTCSGKSGLANLLVKEYSFDVVCDRRESKNPDWHLQLDQPAVLDRRNRAAKSPTELQH